MIAVTILHAPRDKVLADRLAAALTREGFESRFSDGNPDAGDLALEADVAIVVWSASSASMPRLLEQAEEAMNRGILIPVAIGGGNTPQQFSALQPVNLFGWTGEIHDPRWRFMLDEIDIALKRSRPADRAPASAFADSDAEPPEQPEAPAPFIAPKRASAAPLAQRSAPADFHDDEFNDAQEEAAASDLETRLAGSEAHRVRSRSGSYSTAQVAAGTGVVLALLAVAVLFLAPGPQRALDPNIQTVDGAAALPATNASQGAQGATSEDAPLLASAQGSPAGAEKQHTDGTYDAAESEQLLAPPSELRDIETGNGADVGPPAAVNADTSDNGASLLPLDLARDGAVLEPANLQQATPPSVTSADTAEITDLIAAVTGPSATIGAVDAAEPIAGSSGSAALGAPQGTDELAALAEPTYDPTTFIIETSAEPAEPLGVQWLTGHYFLECVDCPEMAEIPAGRFTMGSPDNEPGRTETEGPQVKIELNRDYALSAREVTFKQWQACVADGGCRRYYPADNGWGRGDRPVVNISFEDAASYAAWLSKKTGSNYRLPTEAEWEYAARAGGDGVFGHARAISPARANFDGRYPYGSPRGNYRSSTTPVASFAPNAFGLYDMHGNVWEWTADCWTESHVSAPGDGSARIGDCTQRVLKGGAWNVGGWRLRAAHRIPKGVSARESDNGFRVARDM
ncbi:MAG: SUMF1/EgtB/PvdO family nonheme iron enzyme [Pseudomonadota bacterium]